MVFSNDSPLVIDIHPDSSSITKGESLENTIETLALMGIELFIIRHPEDKISLKIEKLLPDGIFFINAGDGSYAHPSQALLDVYTMKEKCEVRSAKRALSRRSAPHRPRRHDRDRADIHVGAGDRECYRWDAPFPEKFPAKEQQRGLVAFAKDRVAFGVGCDSRIALFAEQ